MCVSCALACMCLSTRTAMVFTMSIFQFHSLTIIRKYFYFLCRVLFSHPVVFFDIISLVLVYCLVVHWICQSLSYLTLSNLLDAALPPIGVPISFRGRHLHPLNCRQFSTIKPSEALYTARFSIQMQRETLANGFDFQYGLLLFSAFSPSTQIRGLPHIHIYV